MVARTTELNERTRVPLPFAISMWTGVIVVAMFAAKLDMRLSVQENHSYETDRVREQRYEMLNQMRIDLAEIKADIKSLKKR